MSSETDATTAEVGTFDLTIQQFQKVLHMCPHIALRIEEYDVVSASVEARDGSENSKLFCIIFRSSNRIHTFTAKISIDDECRFNLAEFERDFEGEFSGEFGRLIKSQEIPECLEEMRNLLGYVLTFWPNF
jgi:hypothetical protein